MKSPFWLVGVVMLGAAVAATAALDSGRIEQVTGLKGAWNAGQTVYKVTQARADLPVSVDGWTMPPFMGLTTWAGFASGTKTEAMVAGDLVLLEDEVNPAMSAALGAGLTVTALHNHFFFDEPKVYFMHIGGEGSLEQLAGGVKAALAAQRGVRAAHPQPVRLFGSAFAPKSNAITGAVIDQLLGTKGQAKDGMFKVVIGRSTRLSCGCEMGADMGVNTWAAFAGTDDNAVVDGDFAVSEDELQPVLKSLRAEGINIVAIHHHMTHEEPRVLFLHYWGRGRVADLAASLKKTFGIQAAVR